MNHAVATQRDKVGALVRRRMLLTRDVAPHYSSNPPLGYDHYWVKRRGAWCDVGGRALRQCGPIIMAALAEHMRRWSLTRRRLERRRASTAPTSS